MIDIFNGIFLSLLELRVHVKILMEEKITLTYVQYFSVYKIHLRIIICKLTDRGGLRRMGPEMTLKNHLEVEQVEEFRSQIDIPSQSIVHQMLS